MTRSRNIFHKLVTGENSATELLCNLMRFAAFRRPLLALFLSAECADKIEFDDIETQITLDNSARPDLVISNDKIYAFIEVKFEEDRQRTPNQPTGYLDALRNDKRRRTERWLVFLVPKNWVHQHELLNLLNAVPQDSNIKTPRPVYWEDVLDIIEKNDLQELNPFFAEFHRLLMTRYRPTPIIFSTKEVVMLFEKDLPDALVKLSQLIDQISVRSSAFEFKEDYDKSLFPEKECGLYFKKKDKDVFFFGVWNDFWKKFGFPLCFGVPDSDNDAVQAFLATYAGSKEQFGGYTLGWVSQTTLASKNAVEEIWKQLAPVLEAVVGARSEGRTEGETKTEP